MAAQTPTRRKERPKGYRELLLGELGQERYEGITKSYDQLGNIVIIDVEKRFAGKVARIILETHKNAETVLRKEGAVSGRYRTRKYSFVMGKRGYVARYKENGASFVFDVRKTFFSSRLAYERKRITDLSKDGELVVVMFAGIGPFAIEIAKKNRASRVVAIELNKAAYGYMLENIKLNKTSNVIPVLGNAMAPPREYLGMAERIIMPLPMDSSRFLAAALSLAAPRCAIHYYAFVDDGGEGEVGRISLLCQKRGLAFRLLGRRAVRPYSSKISEIVIDFEISAKGYKP